MTPKEYLESTEWLYTPEMREQRALFGLRKMTEPQPPVGYFPPQGREELIIRSPGGPTGDDKHERIVNLVLIGLFILAIILIGLALPL